MKTGFKDEVKLTGPKKTKAPWDFTQPTYDQRSSCFINAGTEQGVGKKCPVGKEGDVSAYSIPMGKVDTLKVVNINYSSFDDQ